MCALRRLWVHSLRYLHAQITQVIRVVDNVRHMILIYCNFASINPVLDELGRIFSLISNLFHFSQLLFERLDVIELVSDLRVLLLLVSFHSIVECLLNTHQALRTSPLAARLEDVNTTALGG